MNQRSIVTIAHTTATTAENYVVQIDTVLIKVASRCNINCSYCYVYNMGDSSWEDMPNFVSRDTIAAIADNLAKVSELLTRI